MRRPPSRDYHNVNPRTPTMEVTNFEPNTQEINKIRRGEEVTKEVTANSRQVKRERARRRQSKNLSAKEARRTEL